MKVTQDALKRKNFENIAVVEGKHQIMKIYLHKTECKTKCGASKPKVRKMVSDADEKKWKATLQSIDEEFTWHVNYHFGMTL